MTNSSPAQTPQAAPRNPMLGTSVTTSMKPVFAVYALLFLGCGHTTPKVDPPMEVRELRKEVDAAVVWRPENVPAGENGWALASKAANLCPDTGLDSMGPQASNPAESPSRVLSAWSRPGEGNLIARSRATIRSYDLAFPAIEEALKRPRWVAPEPRDDTVPNIDAEAQIVYPSFSKYKELARAFLLRSRLSMSSGRTKAAAADILSAETIGTRLIESHDDEITELVGIAIRTIAQREIQRRCRDPRWKTVDLQALLRAIPEPKLGVDAAATLRHEFDSHFLRTMAGMPAVTTDATKAAAGFEAKALGQVLEGHPNPFDRRDTIRRASAVLAEMLKCATGPWRGKEAVEKLVPIDVQALLAHLASPDDGPGSDKIEEDRKPTAKDISDAKEALRKIDNPVGKLLYEISLPVFVSTLQADRKSFADTEATRVILAAAIYRSTRSTEPPDLGALVAAGLLKEVPQDPFGTGPMRYDAKRRVLWSVGPDGKDDGGQDPPGVFTATVKGPVKDYVWPTDGRFNR